MNETFPSQCPKRGLRPRVKGPKPLRLPFRGEGPLQNSGLASHWPAPAQIWRWGCESFSDLSDLPATSIPAPLSQRIIPSSAKAVKKNVKQMWHTYHTHTSASLRNEAKKCRAKKDIHIQRLAHQENRRKQWIGLRCFSHRFLARNVRNKVVSTAPVGKP